MVYIAVHAVHVFSGSTLGLGGVGRTGLQALTDGRSLGQTGSRVSVQHFNWVRHAPANVRTADLWYPGGGGDYCWR
jgi:hypothetical protein